MDRKESIICTVVGMAVLLFGMTLPTTSLTINMIIGSAGGLCMGAGAFWVWQNRNDPA
jgi:hypothetical protein